jgi:hypothetical protein
MSLDLNPSVEEEILSAENGLLAFSVEEPVTRELDTADDIVSETPMQSSLALSDSEVVMERRWTNWPDMDRWIKAFAIRRGFNVAHQIKQSQPVPSAPDSVAASTPSLTGPFPEPSSLSSTPSLTGPSCLSPTPPLTPPSNESLSTAVPTSTKKKKDNTKRPKGPPATGYYVCEWRRPQHRIADHQEIHAAGLQDNTQHTASEEAQYVDPAIGRACCWRVLYTWLSSDRVYHLTRPDKLLMPHYGHKMRLTDTSSSSTQLTKQNEVPEEVYASLSEWLLDRYTHQQMKKVRPTSTMQTSSILPLTLSFLYHLLTIPLFIPSPSSIDCAVDYVMRCG